MLIPVIPIQEQHMDFNSEIFIYFIGDIHTNYNLRSWLLVYLFSVVFRSTILI